MSNGTTSKPPLEIALEILGATAGLAATAYFVGSVTIWLRLYVSGFPADIGLELASDGRIIAVGVRGIALVVGILGAIFLLLRLYASYIDSPAGNRVPGKVRLRVEVALSILIFVAAWWTSIRTLLVVMAISPAVFACWTLLEKGREHTRPPSARTLRVAAIDGLVAIIVSAFVGWRLFGLVVAIVGIGFLVALTSKGTDKKGWKVPWWATLAIVGFLVLAATAWQVNAPISIATVRVFPPINPDLIENPALPYFGSSDDLLYVACIVDQSDPKSEQDYRYLRTIVELPRDDLTYVEFSQAEALYPDIKTPAEFARDWILNVVRGDETPEASDGATGVDDVARTEGESEPICQGE